MDETSLAKTQRYLAIADHEEDNPEKTYGYYRLAINAATGIINSCLSEMDMCMIQVKEKAGE